MHPQLVELGFDWWVAAAFAGVFLYLVLIAVGAHYGERRELERQHKRALEVQRRQHEHEIEQARKLRSNRQQSREEANSGVEEWID